MKYYNNIHTRLKHACAGVGLIGAKDTLRCNERSTYKGGFEPPLLLLACPVLGALP